SAPPMNTVVKATDGGEHRTMPVLSPFQNSLRQLGLRDVSQTVTVTAGRKAMHRLALSTNGSGTTSIHKASGSQHQ
ncbi:MAG: hypothetical protein ABI268_14255, partial [Rhodanobacter sp.]